MASAAAAAAAPASSAAAGGGEDYSALWGDQASADVTIKIKTREALELVAQQQKEAAEEEAARKPPAKRRRRGRSASAAAAAASRQAEPEPDAEATDKQQQEQQQEDAGVVATLRVHKRVLAASSEFFDAMLLGSGTAMREGRGDCVTLELEDEQDVADFQRLLKLSYIPSDLESGDRAPSMEELLRLLVLADRFGMRGAMAGCARAFVPLLKGYDEALAYFEGVPDFLPLQAEPLHVATKAAGNALAKALGPVEKLWEAGDEYDGDDWAASYVLDERVIMLPIGGIEALLRSEELQLKSENYCFTLAMWWVIEQRCSGDEEAQPLFTRLLKSLRYSRMSAEFLAAIADDSWVKESGLLSSIMQRAIWRRGHGRQENPMGWPSSRVKVDDRLSYSCSFTTHFTKAAIEALREPNDSACAPLGLLHGFPCFVELIRQEDGRLCLLLFSEFLEKDEGLDTPGEAEWDGQDEDEWRGFEFTVVRGTVGTAAVDSDMIYESLVTWAHYIFECSTDALVYDEQGNLKVELELDIEQDMDC